MGEIYMFREPLFLFIVLTAMVVPGSMVSAYQSEQHNRPICVEAFGDIYGGDKNSNIHIVEIDGTALSSPADLARQTVVDKSQVTHIKGGDFSGWDFRGVSLSRTCFEKSNLAGSNWQGVNAPAIGFIAADLTQANMRDAQMPGILLRNVELSGVISAGADFSQGQFDGGWFEAKIDGWNLDYADLTNFRFMCSLLIEDGCPVNFGDPGISMVGTNLTHADLSTYFRFDDVTAALLDGTILSPSQLPDFSSANFAGDIVFPVRGKPEQFSPQEVQAIIAAHGAAIENDRPGFDCAKATIVVEKEICDEYAYALRAQDRELAILYKEALSQAKTSRTAQRAWLKKRNGCADDEFVSDCLHREYDARIGQLLGLLGDTQWLMPGERQIFVDEVLQLPEHITSQPYYNRLVLALAHESGARIMISRNDDGYYSILGDAVRANGHLCTVMAHGMRFDAKTGWYGVTLSDGQVQPIFRYLNGRIMLLGDGKPDHEQWPDAGEYLSCGARGYFDDLVAIDLPPAVIDHYADQLKSIPN